MRTFPRMLAGALALALAGAAGSGRGGPVPQPSSGVATRPAPPSLPQTPGHHRLFKGVVLGGAPRRLAYLLVLPKGYDPRGRPWPMVVFLNGAGEVGDNHEGLYVHGPAAEQKRVKEVAARAGYIVLCPQCPGGLRWDSPGMAEAAVEIIRHVQAGCRVDANRIYLTGLSMGGAGVWWAALAGPRMFAAIAPICSVAVEPKKMPAALAGTTVWVLVGDADGGYTEGSKQQAAALRAAGIDTILTLVPGRGHDLWATYYARPEFYDFLLMHRRGGGPPANRPIPEELLAWAYRPPNSMDARLAEPFRKFLPWWTLLNCGGQGPPGLRENFAGRGKVFVTAPLDAATPCRLITTINVPPGRTTVLRLSAGHAPGEAWELMVRANEKDVCRAWVGRVPTSGPAETSPAGATPAGGAQAASRPASAPALPVERVIWRQHDIDLTAFAGREVRIQLLNSAGGQPAPVAYWADVEVRHK